MSTRATYQIDFTTFYIHHDGYPEGAAMYFRKALAQPEFQKDRAPNATFADDFMRANDRAELTPGHDAHGDTEYQYTITTEGDFRFGPSKLHLEVKDVWGNEIIFSGDINEFVEQYDTLTA